MGGPYRGSSGYFTFLSKRNMERMQASSQRMKKVAYSEWLALQGQEWNSLCLSDKASYQVEERSHVSSTREYEAEAPDRNLVMNVNMEQ